MSVTIDTDLDDPGKSGRMLLSKGLTLIYIRMVFFKRFELVSECKDPFFAHFRLPRVAHLRLDCIVSYRRVENS